MGKSFYNISFNEGIEHNTLEVYASDYIELIEKNKNLKNMINDKENNEFIYRLTFEKKEHFVKNLPCLWKSMSFFFDNILESLL